MKKEMEKEKNIFTKVIFSTKSQGIFIGEYLNGERNGRGI